MPALVNSKLGESGIKLAERTIVWPFDLKKSRNDCLISALVIGGSMAEETAFGCV